MKIDFKQYSFTAKLLCRLLIFLSAALCANPIYAQQNTDAEDGVLLDKLTVEGDSAGGVIENNSERVAPTGKLNAAIADTPFSISVVDEAFIEDTGAKNIQDALLYSSGVYSGQFGFDTRGDWTSVRGLDAANYQDGLRSIYGYYNSVRTNAYTLESIEVLKGPSSVLYGQSELGGIVNAVSKLPKADGAGELWLQLGSYDRTQLAADFTGPLSEDGRWLYRLVALARESGTQVDHVNDDGYVFSPSITWLPDDKTSLTLLFNEQETEGQVSAQFLPSRGTIDPAPLGQIPTNRFVGEPGWDRYDREKSEITLFFNRELSANWRMVSVFRQADSSAETREHWISIPLVPADNGDAERTIYTVDRATDIFNFDIRLEGEFSTGAAMHSFVAGIDRQDAFWEQDNSFYGYALGGTINLYNPVYGNLNDDVIDPVDLADNEIQQLGIYLVDNIEIGKVIVSAAVRQDDSDNKEIDPSGNETVSSDSELTGRLGLMYQFDSGVSPYVSFSEAFTPNLGTDDTGGTLDPTTGEQTEAGIKYLSPDKTTSINFAWFDIEQENRIAQGQNPGGVTQIGAVIEGWELELKKRWNRFEMLANYTDLNAEDGQTGERLSFVAETFWSLWGKYEFINGFRAGFGSRHTGDNVGSDIGNGPGPVVPAVTLYDAMLGYPTGDWDFSVNAQNLTDEVYISWCRYEGADCGYGERRHVSANARYAF